VWKILGCVRRFRDMLEVLRMCWKVWGCVGKFRDVLEGLGMCWKA